MYVATLPSVISHRSECKRKNWRVNDGYTLLASSFSDILFSTLQSILYTHSMRKRYSCLLHTLIRYCRTKFSSEISGLFAFFYRFQERCIRTQLSPTLEAAHSALIGLHLWNFTCIFNVWTYSMNFMKPAKQTLTVPQGLMGVLKARAGPV